MKRKYMVVQRNNGKNITLQFSKFKIMSVFEGDVVELDLKEYNQFRHVFEPLDDIIKKQNEREEIIRNREILRQQSENKVEEYKESSPTNVFEEVNKKEFVETYIEDNKEPEHVIEIELIPEEEVIIENKESNSSIQNFDCVTTGSFSVPLGNLEDYKYHDLKKLCEERGLNNKGKKIELIERLNEYHNNLR